MYLQKVKRRKNCVKKFYFAGILKVNDENSRSRIQIRIRIWMHCQRHGSADLDPDPDPHQNVMDPEHWIRFIDIMGLNFLTINCRSIQRTFLGKKSSFFAIFGGEKVTFVCEKTMLMLSFFSQRLRKSADSPSRGVVDSPTHEQSSAGGHFAQSIFRDGSVRGTITKGRFVQGAQHPRIFGRRHIGRGRTNIAPFQAAANPIVLYCTYSHFST